MKILKFGKIFEASGKVCLHDFDIDCEGAELDEAATKEIARLIGERIIADCFERLPPNGDAG